MEANSIYKAREDLLHVAWEWDDLSHEKVELRKSVYCRDLVGILPAKDQEGAYDEFYDDLTGYINYYFNQDIKTTAEQRIKEWGR